jgi:tetratricopeptide (TPR) repeat protein
MRKTYSHVMLVALIIIGLTAPVFGQNSDDEARKYLVRGMAAIEMAKSVEELTVAAAEFKKATEIAPNMAAAWYNLGSVQVKIESFKEAIYSYKKYLALMPQAEDARKINDEIIKLEYRLELLCKIKSRDARYIAYENGTVLDTKTNLMWAAKDNGSGITWMDAKSYCNNYRGGSYADWRMPTQDELAELYDAGKSRQVVCYTSDQIHIATELIDITCCCVWASETRGSDATDFSFCSGSRTWTPQSLAKVLRVLPVRSGK